jgi:hypothetical protein
MIHWWLVPLMIVLGVAICAFYLLVRFTGGDGIRSEGRTVVDKPQEEDNPPPR